MDADENHDCDGIDALDEDDEALDEDDESLDEDDEALDEDDEALDEDDEALEAEAFDNDDDEAAMDDDDASSADVVGVIDMDGHDAVAIKRPIGYNVAGNTYPTFTREDLRMLQESVNRAHAMILADKAMFDEIWKIKGLGKWKERKEMWKRPGGVGQYFGSPTLTRARMDRVQNRMNRLERIFRKHSFRFLLHASDDGSCTPTTRAYNTGNTYRVHICLSFWPQASDTRFGGRTTFAGQTTECERARFLIHELVHGMGFAGHPSYKYCEGHWRAKYFNRQVGSRDFAARQLGGLHPIQAGRNPDTWMLFCDWAYRNGYGPNPFPQDCDAHSGSCGF